MELEIVRVLLLSLPNWAGFLLLTFLQNRFNERLLKIIETRAERDRVADAQDNTRI